MGLGFEILIVLVLIVANGLFSMSETAVVSSHQARLQQRAGAGDAKAHQALALAHQPNVFLATVQVGISLIGVLSGALGGATVARSLTPALEAVPGIEPYAETVAVAAVVLVITYLSLVIGELVPKRIALNNPEGIAAAVAGPMGRLTVGVSPVVRLLGSSTDGVLRLLRVQESGKAPVSAEEVGVLLEQGARAGVFDPAEQEMITSVFALADDTVAALLTPRPDIVWLDLEDPPLVNWRTMAASPFSRFPVCRGDLDNVVGMVRAKDLLVDSLIDGDRSFDLEGAMHPPLVVPKAAPALRVLEGFRRSGEHLALVVDEYGGTAGIVTTQDVLEAIIGDRPDHGGPGDLEATRQADGAWRLAGTLDLDRLQEILALTDAPEDAAAGFQTLGGFMLAQLDRIPAAGDGFAWAGWQFEVAAMDGHRVQTVVATPIAAGRPAAASDRAE